VSPLGAPGTGGVRGRLVARSAAGIWKELAGWTGRTGGAAGGAGSAGAKKDGINGLDAGAAGVGGVNAAGAKLAEGWKKPPMLGGA
jgi:hypothetical protein